MKIKKLYFNKLYNQWRDYPFIHEELPFKDRKLNKHLIERHWDLLDYTVRKERYL